MLFLQQFETMISFYLIKVEKFSFTQWSLNYLFLAIFETTGTSEQHVDWSQAGELETYS